MVDKAVLFGATGAVGRELLSLLCKASHYANIVVVLRRQDIKLENIAASLKDSVTFVVDPNLSSSQANISFANADVFCTLGTTLKRAGSRKAFFQVDFELVLNIAKQAKQQQAASFHVISSLNANPESSNYYLQTKGKMESALKALELTSLFIYRPSLLYAAQRSQFRIAESLGLLLLYPLSFFPFERLQRVAPIKAAQVAQAMLSTAADEPSGTKVFENDVMKQVLK
ncbi:NAD(P)H-binding protein [Aliikangiella sp. IMCC44632]